MVKFANNVNKNLRWHGNIVAYCVLAVGLVAAIWMIQSEVGKRSGADQEIREVIRVEIDEESRARIKALEDLNAKQTLIIRALLKARGLNPDLFDGARLPGDADATAAPPARDGRAQPRGAAQRPTSGTTPKPKPKPTTPKPDVAGPTPRTPTPTTPTPPTSSTPTPTNPVPTTPAPTTPPPTNPAPVPPVIITPPPIPPTPTSPPIISLPVLPIIGKPVVCVARPLLPCLLG